MPEITELVSDNLDLDPGSLALKSVLFFYHVICHRVRKGQQTRKDTERRLNFKSGPKTTEQRKLDEAAMFCLHLN